MNVRYDDIVDRVKGAALGRIPTMELTAHAVKRCITGDPPVLGDFVECGVFAGVHPAIMALVAERCGKQGVNRRIHLFDSFEGIPQAGPQDDESITALIGPSSPNPELKSTGVSACSVEQVAKNMKHWRVNGRVLQWHKGWFQDTVPKALFPNGIAILRLDGDLYESTRVCLEHLHPKVNPGGWVIVDDYALTGCRRAVDEYLAANGFGKVKLEEVPDGGGPAFYIKP